MTEALAIDIGSHTQDILLYDSDIPIDRCLKLILPSQTSILAGRIREATRRGADIFLHGDVMGGGPITQAVREHIEKGLRVFATRSSALTFHDNLDKVHQLGIIVQGDQPPRTLSLETRDIDLPALKLVLRLFDINLPPVILVCAQDHGFNPERSNRLSRFELWKEFLSTGDLSQLLYDTPPPSLTRLGAIKALIPGSLVMDSCASAIRGALADPVVEQRAKQGVVLINIGNQHTISALYRQGRAFAIFEHHTSCLSAERLDYFINRFRSVELTMEEVLEDQGHGCSYADDITGSFEFISVTGPCRWLAPADYYRAVPGGDATLVGCFGLLLAYQDRLRRLK